jgi:hypothetical protein
MSMVSEYWAEVNDTLRTIKVDLAKQSKQPTTGDGCYIVSVKNRVQRTEAGVVSLAGLKLAAQRVTDGSHVLATDDQIVAYEADQAKKREAAKAAEMRMRGTTYVPTAPTK